MKLTKQIILICLLGVLPITFINLFSQGTQNKPTRQSSMEAFSQGNYEKAYDQFRELLLTYSKDPLYKYYSGVCLVKLNRNPSEAASLLNEAIAGNGSVKTLPEDGFFFLGRAQQMSGKYNEAIASYKSYTDRVGKKVSKEMGVPGLIQECTEKKGQVSDITVKPAEAISISKSDSIRTDLSPVVKEQAIKEPVNREPVNKPAPKIPATKAKLPSDYEKTLSEAIEYQYKADSVSVLTSNQKKEIDKLSGNDKLILKTKILENEKLAASYQNKADEKYRAAQFILNPQADTVKPSQQITQQAQVKPVIDTVKKVYRPVVKESVKKPDTIKTTPPVSAAKAGVYSFFEVLAQPANDPRAKLIIDQEVPPGLIYRIQIAVFRNPVTPAFFKGLSPIYGFKIAGTDKTIYYAGAFRRSADAAKALTTVKAKGFKDSFIVALLANKTVSSDRAAIIEKEWGNKPFAATENNSSEIKADTIPPTLTFRVEVTRSAKPLKEDAVDEMRKIAGTKGLDVITLEDGKIDYLIGNFITFDTAAEYSDLLKRNGYRDSQVVAWLGKKEIPIETARELFDKLK